MVVRESLSLDLLDRLISDICAVTESLMNTSDVDLAAWQPFTASIEKKHANAGLQPKHHSKAERPMSDGIHRTVC